MLFLPFGRVMKANLTCRVPFDIKAVSLSQLSAIDKVHLRLEHRLTQVSSACFGGRFSKCTSFCVKRTFITCEVIVHG